MANELIKSGKLYSELVIKCLDLRKCDLLDYISTYGMYYRLNINDFLRIIKLILIDSKELHHKDIRKEIIKFLLYIVNEVLYNKIILPQHNISSSDNQYGCKGNLLKYIHYNIINTFNFYLDHSFIENLKLKELLYNINHDTY